MECIWNEAFPLSPEYLSMYEIHSIKESVYHAMCLGSIFQHFTNENGTNLYTWGQGSRDWDPCRAKIISVARDQTKIVWFEEEVAVGKFIICSQIFWNFKNSHISLEVFSESKIFSLVYYQWKVVVQEAANRQPRLKISLKESRCCLSRMVTFTMRDFPGQPVYKTNGADPLIYKSDAPGKIGDILKVFHLHWDGMLDNYY